MTTATRRAFDLHGLHNDGTERRVTCPARWEDDTSRIITTAPEIQQIRDLIAAGIGWCMGVGMLVVVLWLKVVP